MRGRLFLLVLSLVAVCCSRPSSREYFVLAEDAEYGDTYSFFLDLDDSTATYSLDFFTRVERDSFGDFLSDDIVLDLRWFSPSDSILTDTAYVKLRDVAGEAYYTRDLVTPYRAKPGLPEWGEWRLKARVVNNSDLIRGLGIILRYD